MQSLDSPVTTREPTLIVPEFPHDHPIVTVEVAVGAVHVAVSWVAVPCELNPLCPFFTHVPVPTDDVPDVQSDAEPLLETRRYEWLTLLICHEAHTALEYGLSCIYWSEAHTSGVKIGDYSWLDV